MHHFRTLSAAVAVVALALTACGSDDDGGGGAQSELADEVIAALEDFASEDGIEFDEDCVRDIVGEMSDDDADESLEVLQNPDSDSDAFDATGERIETECFTFTE
jgi:hypothetical protein